MRASEIVSPLAEKSVPALDGLQAKATADETIRQKVDGYIERVRREGRVTEQDLHLAGKLHGRGQRLCLEARGKARVTRTICMVFRH